MKNATLELRTCDQVAKASPADFNRLARVYRWMEWFSFGPLLWRCRCTFLDAMKGRHSALIVGDGDGRFTSRLLAENSQITIEAIDASEAMLDQLLVRAGRNAGRVHTTLADARRPIALNPRFDLVVTHFFLDCLTTEEVESLAKNVCRKLGPGAVWIVSEFAVPDNLYGRLVALPVVSALYLAFGLLTGLEVRRLPRHREALQRAGFVLIEERKRLLGLLVSEKWQAVRAT